MDCLVCGNEMRISRQNFASIHPILKIPSQVSIAHHCDHCFASYWERAGGGTWVSVLDGSAYFAEDFKRLLKLQAFQ